MEGVFSTGSTVPRIRNTHCVCPVMPLIRQLNNNSSFLDLTEQESRFGT